MNIEPATCNGDLPYPWGQHQREEKWGRWTQGWGVGGAKCLEKGRGFIFTSWLFDHSNSVIFFFLQRVA